MDDRRLDAALRGLAMNVPRAPAESVEAMMKTVQALNAERARRSELAGDTPSANREKELAPRPQLKKPNKKKTL